MVDPTGAGNAFLGGLGAGLCEDDEEDGEDDEEERMDLEMDMEMDVDLQMDMDMDMNLNLKMGNEKMHEKMVRAAAWGNVAASFAVEQVGVPRVEYFAGIGRGQGHWIGRGQGHGVGREQGYEKDKDKDKDREEIRREEWNGCGVRERLGEYLARLR